MPISVSGIAGAVLMAALGFAVAFLAYFLYREVVGVLNAGVASAN